MSDHPVKPSRVPAHPSHHQRLADIARRVMLDRGLAPDYPPEALAQLARIAGPARLGAAALSDLTGLPWCSIDNDDSRDLDQITACEERPGGAVRILVAIADVDAVVAKGTPLDDHARLNTTSVYTAGGIFPMLPEPLSTDMTSLSEGEEREALVYDFLVGPDGALSAETVHGARVTNRAKLAYPSVAAWLEGEGPLPAPAARVPGMDRQLRVQDEVAQRLRARRFAAGALEFETLQPRAVVKDGVLVGLEPDPRNRARELIEELMVAANGVSARFLSARGVPSMRRVVRSPERWARIVAYAATFGGQLPAQPDSAALERFLADRRRLDPLRFPDISLTIVKLMGRGEYVVALHGAPGPGHFGLAVRDYTHSTAPNRRFPDLLTGRLVKSVLAGAPPAYSAPELVELAAHCTVQEDAADKVERHLRKSAGALLLSNRIGARFEAIVTGANPKGTWVRVFHPPVEGRLVHGHDGPGVGRRLSVKLVSVDVEHGYLDFAAE